MGYSESVRFLYALGNEIKTAKLGLDRIVRLLERLGNPHSACRFVHVAGTNGKGSVCAMVECALRAAGIRTALFTSPHLSEPTERIQIDGQPVSRDLFARAFERVHQAAEGLLAEGAIDFHPTYFETVTAMAFVIFRELHVDTAVLEVGLGGRLDATNVVLPRISVITAIDFDHEAFLGKSLESIASEKAGIFKPGVPAVLAPQRPEVTALLESRAAETGAPVVRVADWTAAGVELHPRGSRFMALGPVRVAVECPLAGAHQVSNALTAVAVLHRLGVTPEAIQQGIRLTQWPGRLEFVATRPEIILDGAHNPSGARALRSYMDRFFGDRRVWLVYGAMRDKSVAEMAGILFPRAAEVILTAPDNPRALRPQAIRELVDHPSIRLAASVREAAAVLKEVPPDDVVFVCGTLFLVGEARSLLLQ